MRILWFPSVCKVLISIRVTCQILPNYSALMTSESTHLLNWSWEELHSSLQQWIQLLYLKIFCLLARFSFCSTSTKWRATNRPHQDLFRERLLEKNLRRKLSGKQNRWKVGWGRRIRIELELLLYARYASSKNHKSANSEEAVCATSPRYCPKLPWHRI